jgi:tetratricopeptide (TPR) repeat protein
LEQLSKRLPGDLRILQKLGSLYMASGDLYGGLKADHRTVLIAPNSAAAHYNLACSYALLGQHKFAISHLKIALELGFCDIEHICADENLDAIRSTPAFRNWLQSIQ